MEMLNNDVAYVSIVCISGIFARQFRYIPFYIHFDQRCCPFHLNAIPCPYPKRYADIRSPNHVYIHIRIVLLCPHNINNLIPNSEWFLTFHPFPNKPRLILIIVYPPPPSHGETFLHEVYAEAH